MALTGACGCIASTKSSAAGDRLKAKSSGTLRISSGFLLFDNFGVQRDDCLPFRPFEINVFAARCGTYPGLRLSQARGNLYLRQAGGTYFSDE